MFILNPQSGTPIYRQVVEQVRRLIASGQLLPGMALPSVREVAVEHTVNPMTISKAYALLEAEGLLERHRGKPMTVAARKSKAALRKGLLELEDEVDRLILAARQLQLGKRDVIAIIDRKWEDFDAGTDRRTESR